jgi:hypothetical protein
MAGSVVLDTYHDLKSAGGGLLRQVPQRGGSGAGLWSPTCCPNEVVPVWNRVHELGSDRHQDRDPDGGGEQLPAFNEPPAAGHVVR